jgi:hypothetical protein
MKKKGAALLTVVIITSVLFVVAVTLLDRSIRTYRDTMDMITAKEAYYAAESLIFDGIGYANKNNIALNTTKEFNQASGLLSIKAAEYQFKNDYKLTITKLIEPTGNSTIKRYIYNLDSEVRHGGMAYVVKMQIETIFLNNNYIGNSILDRKTYKYKP